MYLTINSEFKPFTYDELTKPLRDYTEAYNKVEEQYATLAQQTEAWKNIATQENSPEAYAMYKKYADELNAVVEDFSKGMTIQNRGKLTGLKSRYASEIGAIDKAYKEMSAANTYRDEVLAKDSSAVFIKNRYNSIDDFLHGQTADNQYISGTQIENSIMGKTYAAANAKFAELTKGGKVSESTAAKMVTSGKAFDVKEVINKELENLEIEKFDPESRAMLERYVASGAEKGFGSFVEKQTLNEAQRQDIALRRASIGAQYASIAENRRQHLASLKSRGLNSDGTIDPTSPVHAANGIQYNQRPDGKWSVTKIDSNGIKTTQKLDVSTGVNTAGEVALINTKDRGSVVNVVDYSTLDSKIQNLIKTKLKLPETADLSALSIDVTTIGSVKYYSLHEGSYKSIEGIGISTPTNNPVSININALTDPI